MSHKQTIVNRLLDKIDTQVDCKYVSVDENIGHIISKSETFNVMHLIEGAFIKIEINY